jgi:energy-coupling factor transport system substrate-specific component
MAHAFDTPTTPSARWGRAASASLVGVISLLGLASFFYPFFLVLPQASAEAGTRGDAPWIFGILMPLLMVLILAELGTQRANAKMIAALGILTAINAVLRIQIGLGDSPTFFFLPILIGYAYGARWGFLLGALSLFVSALLTFGVGPWLPFQMFALGWLGMGAAALRPLGERWGGWREIVALAAYGYMGGMAFGALMNIYSWPWSGAGGLGWRPGSTLSETLRQYWLFYVTTSLAWDTLRGVSTAVFIIVLGKPILRELRRFRRRFVWHEHN